MQSGERSQGEHLRIGYFAQHQLEALDTQASGLLLLQRLRPEASEQEIRNFLGGFGFHGDKALEIIAPFSGGEKARMALACVAWQTPNLLILDEPTNHLDIEMRAALTMALQHFAGAILVVSHDRHLLKATVDEYWLVDNHKIDTFNGDLDDYHAYIQSKDSQAEAVTNTAEGAKPSLDRKEQKRLEAEQRQRLAPLKKELQQCEKRMDELSAQLAKIEDSMADTSLYEATRKDELQQLLQQQVGLKNELEEIEMRWLELQEQLA